MRFRNRAVSSSEDDLKMSAMIDIVFLLLIFFVMTFQVLPLEGDFAIEAAPQSGRAGAPVALLPLHVRLAAGADGTLARVELNGRELESLKTLQHSLIEISADEALADAKLSLQCDPTLKYDHVISALDAVTGYHDNTSTFQPLVKNVSLVESD